MRKQIAAANWKMNKTLAEGSALLNEIIATDFDLTESREVLFAIPSGDIARYKVPLV